jgi:hypothetical protein
MSKQQHESQFSTPTVVALQAFASDSPSLGTLVQAGARYPVDHPVVRAHPGQFTDDGLSNAEMAREMARRFDRPVPEVAHDLTFQAGKGMVPIEGAQTLGTLLPGALRDEDAVICTQSHIGYARDNGVMVPLLDNHEVGQKFHKNDPIVKGYPDHFRPLVLQQEATV